MGKVIPMMCCSPDFTHPDNAFREKEIEKQKGWIDMTFALGGSYCRVLSGQRRPEISIDEGVKLAADCINTCLPYAAERNITLILENHYKDDFWEYPEFAQKMDVFCKLVDSIHHPFFGVNYDPSNTYLAGENPLDLLKRVSHRVVTMHASDRYLKEGTLEDLQREEGGAAGYAKRLSHGEIGKGLNDYDAIFSELKRVGFDNWISIEDGVDGMDQLERSVSFLKNKIALYWPIGNKFALLDATSLHIMEAFLLYPSRCILGEGPLWHPEKKSCFWVDIESKFLYQYHWHTHEVKHWEFDNKISMAIQGKMDDLILGFKGGIARFNLETGMLQWILDIESEFENNRCNDGACDSKGRLWIGTLQMQFEKNAGLFILHR